MPGEHQTEFLSYDEGKVYFLKRTIPYKVGGFELAKTEDGKTGVKSYYRPRDFIYVSEVGSDEDPTMLADLPIERVLQSGDAFWVVTAGEDRKLCKVSRSGGVEEIVRIDDHWVTSGMRYAFSPEGGHLALGIVHVEHDFHDERLLVVVDLKKKRIAFSKERITSLGRWDGIGSRLSFGWENETRLSYGFLSNTKVDVALGKIVGVEEATFIAKADLPPKRKRIGLFDHEHGLLFFKGDSDPVVSVLDGRGVQIRDLEISPHGKWAAFTSVGDRNTYLVDGAEKQKSLLLSGSSFDYKWLPAAGPVK